MEKPQYYLYTGLVRAQQLGRNVMANIHARNELARRAWGAAVGHDWDPAVLSEEQASREAGQQPPTANLEDKS